MNPRRKAALRRRQSYQRRLAARNANPGPRPTHCQRCNRPFESAWNPRIGYWSQCCPNCCARNLFDFLDLKTPPALLDPHTKHPALTDEEFRRSLQI